MTTALRLGLYATILGLALAGCGQPVPSREPAPPANSTTGHKVGVSTGLPERKPDHVVIVIEENRSYQEIAGNRNAPYLNQLLREGANLTNYHGVEHPSQPNYLDLFSGSNQGVTSDGCPVGSGAQNLASELIAGGYTFAGYSEDLPKQGFTGCSNANWLRLQGATYARKHNPWVDFSNVPPSVNLPFSHFPTDYSKLPTVSFVVPNLNHDMHNGSVAAADAWLRSHLDAYRLWARSHNSLLIVTWDEDDRSAANHIPTLLVGPMVRPGNDSSFYNHFNLLATLEAMYGLERLGQSRNAEPLTGIWN